MRAASGAASGARHVLGVGLQALLIAAIIAVVALAMSAVYKPAGYVAGVTDTFAGKSSSDPYIHLSSVAGRSAASVQPTLGDYVTFDTAYPRTLKNPRIEVLCYQDGALVYGEAGGVNESFLLGGGGSTWKDRGGAASCVANLYYYGFHGGEQTYEWLAKDTFSAGG